MPSCNSAESTPKAQPVGETTDQGNHSHNHGHPNRGEASIFIFEVFPFLDINSHLNAYSLILILDPFSLQSGINLWQIMEYHSHT